MPERALLDKPAVAPGAAPILGEVGWASGRIDPPVDWFALAR